MLMVMLLTSITCFGSQRLKLRSCERDALRDISTAALQALHCCTASLQALHVRAAAHRTRGSELSAACSNAIERPVQREEVMAGAPCSGTCGEQAEQQEEQQQEVWVRVESCKLCMYTCLQIVSKIR